MRILLPFCSLALVPALPAQVGRDEWLVATFTSYISTSPPPVTGGIWHVDAAQTTATLLAGQTPDMAAANCVAIDEIGFAYYGTLQTASVPVPHPGSILQVLVAGGSIVAETLLTTQPIDSGSVSGIVVVRDRIWFVTDVGNVGWIPKAGGAPTIVLNLAANGVLGLGQSITSNGREVFVGTSHSPSSVDPANVWELDGLAAAPTLRPLLFLNGSAFALSMARDGQVLVGRVGGQLWLIDPVTATGAQRNVGATAPQSNCNGTAINPWRNVVGNAPGYGTTTRDVAFYDVATNSWTTTLPMNTAIPSGVASAHEEPFLAFGRGCPGSNGLEPRMGWNGLAQQGQSFALTLRDADPNTVGFVFLGVSNTTATIGALPADLTFVGAPGCVQLISDDAPTFATIGSNGTASQSFAVPVNPALAGWEIYGQWALIATVNALGIVTSDAVAIRVR